MTLATLYQAESDLAVALELQAALRVRPHARVVALGEPTLTLP